MRLEHATIVVAMVMYFATGITYFVKGQYAWSLTWLSYGFANVGLMCASK
jgi:cytochrome b subunit of formate dehydrogenase